MFEGMKIQILVWVWAIFVCFLWKNNTNCLFKYLENKKWKKCLHFLQDVWKVSNLIKKVEFQGSKIFFKKNNVCDPLEKYSKWVPGKNDRPLIWKKTFAKYFKTIFQYLNNDLQYEGMLGRNLLRRMTKIKLSLLFVNHGTAKLFTWPCVYSRVDY